MNDLNFEAAESYINGLKQKDLSNVPLAPDVTFEGPLSPNKLEGLKAVTGFLSGIFPIIKDVQIKQHITEGEDVCVFWVLETSTPVASIPICEYVRVSDGMIKELRPYYDPRPITNPKTQ